MPIMQNHVKIYTMEKNHSSFWSSHAVRTFLYNEKGLIIPKDNSLIKKE